VRNGEERVRNGEEGVRDGEEGVRDGEAGLRDGEEGVRDVKARGRRDSEVQLIERRRQFDTMSSKPKKTSK
jgi:hypothetical protein